MSSGRGTRVPIPSPLEGGARVGGHFTRFLGGIVLLAALALGLGGCLVSEAPLIAPGEAAFPLPDLTSAERFKP